MMLLHRGKRRMEVAAHAGQSRPGKGCLGKACVELRLIHAIEVPAIRVVELAYGTELLDGCRLSEAVIPRADVVAYIAAEGVALEVRDDVVGYWASLFDREIGNAPRGVENARRHKGRRGTSVEATGAASAMIELERLVRRKHEIGEDGPDEEEGPH